MRLLHMGGAWVLGIALGLVLSLPLPAILVAFLLPLPLLLVYRQRKGAWLAALYFITLLLGLVRSQQAAPPPMEDLALYTGKGRVAVRGMVESDPELLDRGTRLRLAAREVEDGEGTHRVVGRVQAVVRPTAELVQRRGEPYFRYGDLLELWGRLEEPPVLEGFDYREYLVRQGIPAVMDYPSVKLLAEGEGFAPLRWVYSLRQKMARVLAQALPEPQAALAQGMLLGVRSGIPAELSQAFAITGTTHIIAISGVNVSIVAGMFLSLCRWLFGRGSPLSFLLPLLAVGVYAVLAGMAPSVVRAAIMGGLYLVAHWLGREDSAPTSLVVVAAVMLGVNPLLLGDISFQLSFLAMAGLIYLAPPLHRAALGWLKQGQPSAGGRGVLSIVSENVSITLAATLATLPAIAFHFGRVSLVGLPATLLVLPALPPILALSFPTALVGLGLPGVAQVLAWADWLWLTYAVKAVSLLARLPLAAVEPGRLHPALVGAYYAVLVLALWSGANRRHLKEWSRGAWSWLRTPRGRRRVPMRWAFLVLGMAAALVWIAALTPRGGNLKVVFLEVGQGDAILIVTPAGQKVLVDGGPSPRDISLELGKRLPFWDRTLDLVVLTHPHEDHLAGLVEILGRYRVKGVLESGQGATSATYAQWQKLLDEKGIPRSVAVAGQELDLGRGARLQVLNPQQEPMTGTSSDLDNNSVVLRLEYGQASFLLTGEIHEEAERLLVAWGWPLESTVLKVAHHGSRTSSAAGFLEAVKPQVAVISVGADNPFGHPAGETLDRLDQWLAPERLLLTSERGSIEVSTDGTVLRVRTEREALPRAQPGATTLP